MKPLTAVQVGAGWFAENPGGLDRYYFDLLNVLPNVGVQCRGLVVGSPAVEQETDGEVRAFAAPNEPVRRRWKGVRTAVGRYWQTLPEPRLLVTHFALYAYPLIKDARNRPWVMHFHGPWAAESQVSGGNAVVTWFKRRIEKAVYKKADRVIVLSAAFGELVCKSYGVDPARVDVIPGGVDMDRFTVANDTDRAVARRQLGWPVDRPIVLTVRRLTGRMGLETLIDAMVEVQKRVPNALCLIAGRGPLAATLVAKIDAAGLGDSVTLLGFVPDEDLPLAYRAADVSILPTEVLEGFGLSAAESLAAGTPVIVTPVGGLPEVVGDLDPRLVLPDASARSMADALVRAFVDPATLPSAERCRAYADERFDWTVVGRRIAAVYARAVAKA